MNMWFSELVERTYNEYRRMALHYTPLWEELCSKEQEMWCNVVRCVLRNC